ncbi:MAG: hypothetical protein LBR11_00345 [Deltaproteobacteria bacterium]|nr:hypothetical protein [Deltaproteobacteria bacterium]
MYFPQGPPFWVTGLVDRGSEFADYLIETVESPEYLLWPHDALRRDCVFTLVRARGEFERRVRFLNEFSETGGWSADCSLLAYSAAAAVKYSGEDK